MKNYLFKDVTIDYSALNNIPKDIQAMLTEMAQKYDGHFKLINGTIDEDRIITSQEDREKNWMSMTLLTLGAFKGLSNYEKRLLLAFYSVEFKDCWPEGTDDLLFDLYE